MTAELLTKIESAFKNTPKPSGVLSHNSNDNGRAKYFSGSSWNEHKATDLRLHFDAFYEFEPEAFRYYLPAFMLADISDPIDADIIGEAIASFFTPRANVRLIDKEYINKRIALFSPQEIAAIVAFITWFDIECEGVIEAKQAIEYLESFADKTQDNNQT
mgnify:CR=1 FL=1